MKSILGAILLGIVLIFTSEIMTEKGYDGYSDGYLVVSVVDGDTILVSDKGVEFTVRLIGIDAPETHHPTKSVQCYGKEATDYLESRLSGKVVFLETDTSETDRYDRLLRYVYLEEEFINESLVKNGYALSKSYYPDTFYQDILDFAETSARINNLGLWNPETCNGILD